MKRKSIVFSILSLWLIGVLFQGGSSGCGGNNAPATAKKLEGTYDCISGCTGECTFSDTIEIAIGEHFEEDHFTVLNVMGAISTVNHEYSDDLGGSAGVNDAGEVGFIYTLLGGNSLKCD